MCCSLSWWCYRRREASEIKAAVFPLQRITSGNYAVSFIWNDGYCKRKVHLWPACAFLFGWEMMLEILALSSCIVARCIKFPPSCTRKMHDQGSFRKLVSLLSLSWPDFWVPLHLYYPSHFYAVTTWFYFVFSQYLFFWSSTINIDKHNWLWFFPGYYFQI